MEMRARLLRPWLLSLAFTVIYVGIILTVHGWDPLALVMPGTRYSRLDPHGTEGYDGQFAYYIALDPLGAVPHIDVPAYRYQRILYPLLSRFLAFGDPAFIPWAMLLVNLVALAAGTYFTERMLEGFGVSPLYAVTYGLFPGLLLSVRLDLNEPLAYGLVQAGVYAYERKRPLAGAGLLGLACLAKETSLPFVAGYAMAFALARQWRHLGELALLALLPEALLQLLLKLWLGEFGLGSGGAGASPFSPVPFGGLIEVGFVKLKALLLWLAILGPTVVIPVITALIFLAYRFHQGERHPIAFCLAFNALALVFLPFSTWREFLAMLRVMTGFVASTVLYGAMLRSRRILNYSLFWLALLVFLVKE